MKKITSYFILTILCCSSIYAQKLTLTDLTSLCSKKNWEEVNQTLRVKGWEYHESSKGNTYQYNTITWSYEKSRYDNKALAWFYLFTYDGLPNKITYTVHNQDSYSIIQKSIATAGFKLTDSGGHIFYQKGNYIKDKREGKWTEYDEDGKVTATFNYKNGELHGEAVCESILYCGQYTPKEKKQFKDGKLTELIVYDSLGTNTTSKYEIYDEKYNGYKCRYTRYYKDGFISQEYWLKKSNNEKINHDCFEQMFWVTTSDLPKNDEIEGYADGEHKRFNANNQPIVTGKLHKKDMIGLWTFYYYDQNVKIQSNYAQSKQTDEKYLKLNGGLYSGTFVHYDNENGIKEERKIKDGLRNGKTAYIDIETKKTINKENYKNGVLK